MVEYPDEGFQESEFGVRHLEARLFQHGSVLSKDIVLIACDQVVQSLSLQQGQVGLCGCRSHLVVFIFLEREGAYVVSEWNQASVSISGKDGLGNVPLILFVQGFSELNS